MLVLSRKVGETIILGPEPRILIGVTDILKGSEGTKVRLGIEADKSVVIARGELEKEFFSEQSPKSPLVKDALVLLGRCLVDARDTELKEDVKDILIRARKEGVWR